jgi:hypothetical protein
MLFLYTIGRSLFNNVYLVQRVFVTMVMTGTGPFSVLTVLGPSHLVCFSQVRHKRGEQKERPMHAKPAWQANEEQYAALGNLYRNTVFWRWIVHSSRLGRHSDSVDMMPNKGSEWLQRLSQLQVKPKSFETFDSTYMQTSEESRLSRTKDRNTKR